MGLGLFSGMSKQSNFRDSLNGCGAEENRTPDLCNANAALSQLSYGPMINDEFTITNYEFKKLPVRRSRGADGRPHLQLRITNYELRIQNTQ